MKRKLTAMLATAALIAALPAGNALAKDLFYYIGYGLIQVVDGDSDAIVADIPVDGWLRETEFSKDQRFLYVTAKRRLIHKIDLTENRVVKTIDVNSDGWDRFVYGFDLAADGETAWVNLLSRKTAMGEPKVMPPMLAQIRLEDGRILRSIEMPWSSVMLVSAEEADSVFVIGKDIVRVDVSGKDMKIADTYPMFEKMWNILPLWDYTRENGGVFIGNYYTPEIMGLVSIDTATGEITDTPLDGPPVFAYSVVRSPNGKKAYAVMDELTVIDLESASYDAIIPVPEGTCYGINTSSDGTKVYVTGAGSTTTVFDAQTLQPIKVLQMETDGMDIRRRVM